VPCLRRVLRHAAGLVYPVQRIRCGRLKEAGNVDTDDDEDLGHHEYEVLSENYLTGDAMIRCNGMILEIPGQLMRDEVCLSAYLATVSDTRPVPLPLDPRPSHR